MEDPYGDREYDKHDQHDEAERAHEVAEHGAECVSEKVAEGNKAPGPQTGGEAIQRQAFCRREGPRGRIYSRSGSKAGGVGHDLSRCMPPTRCGWVSDRVSV